MDRKAEEIREGQRVILSDRSRDIIRLFEDLQRKRQQAKHWPTEARLDDKRLTLIVVGVSIGFAAIGIAGLFSPTPPEQPAVASATGVRVIGPAFVPNVNPRER